MQIAEPTEHPGPSPTLRTFHQVERVLRDAADADEPPLSMSEIARRLSARKTRIATVKAAVMELARFSLVVYTEAKGAVWVEAPDKIWDMPREPLA